MGVTGTRASVGEAAAALAGRVRAATELPVCVGIGISTAAQAAHVAGFADGVIVESVLVKAILDAPDEAAGLRGHRQAHRRARRRRPARAIGSSGHAAARGRGAGAPGSRLALSLLVLTLSL